jgi:dUTP pyrophosphatase
MPVLNGKSLVEKKIVIPYVEEAIQSGGYDLSVRTIEYQDESIQTPRITVDNKKRVINNWKLYPESGNFYELDCGTYKTTFCEVISIPDDCIGLIFPRSSLLRSNCTMTTAVWDSGYTGTGFGYLIVNNEYGIDIEKGAPICQLIILTLDTVSKIQYGGAYQHEGINKS